ncbi:MAG: adenylosuccinate lyase [Chitinophagales bacterium]|nr:adenylosuccinate lyase [Chitinophagales bacterium]
MSQDAALYAISPIDGRYRDKLQPLSEYFSEYALIKYRVEIEIRYILFLSNQGLPQLPAFSENQTAQLESIYTSFTVEHAKRIKEIEKTTNHDVKAVEYFIKEQIKAMKISFNEEFIHFGLTSQDINNTAIPLLLKRFIVNVYLPELESLQQKINAFSHEWKDVSMLAKTHGQPASPTSLGKEMAVFNERILVQLDQLLAVPFSAKFGGATGNFNAHKVSFPALNWIQLGNEFVASLGLKRSRLTTQIEHYDNLAALCDSVKRIDNILIDFCRDMWTYISMEYFKQKIKAGEIGSSAMPHKVNPIDFENAEGNLGMANAILEHLAAKLPISRLQRDLTDSTVLRNIGVPFGHVSIAFQSINKGMDKLLLNKEAIHRDLENNWIVIAEAIQTILRRENIPNPYEKLKDLTRINEKINQQTFVNFIDSMDIEERIKKELKEISPFNYIGYTLEEQSIT